MSDTDPSPPPVALPSKLRVPQVPARTKPLAQVIAESAVDVLAIAAVFVLALKGRVDGIYALLAVLVLAGVRVSDLVAIAQGKPPSGGAAGLVVGMLGALLHRGAQGGFARSSALRLVGWLSLAALVAPALTRCTPSAPPPRVAARAHGGFAERGALASLAWLGFLVLLLVPLCTGCGAGGLQSAKGIAGAIYSAICGEAGQSIERVLLGSPASSGGASDGGVILSQKPGAR